MPFSSEKCVELLNLLRTELDCVLRDAVQIALRQSLYATALVSQLETNGYQVTTDLQYTLSAVPMELVFSQNLTEDDKHFLRRNRVKPEDADGSHDMEADRLDKPSGVD